MSIESVMPSHHLIFYRPLLLPSIFPSIRVFSNKSALRIRWTKYWSFSFNISPSNEHSGLISFRMDWLDLFAVQGTRKSLLQHHNSKASILRRSAFFKNSWFPANIKTWFQGICPRPADKWVICNSHWIIVPKSGRKIVKRKHTSSESFSWGLRT